MASGEHPEFPLAELTAWSAAMAAEPLEVLSPRLHLSTAPQLEVLSMYHAVGDLLAHGVGEPTLPEALPWGDKDRLAVRATRLGTKASSPLSATGQERALGGALVDRGYAIDLQNPTAVLELWFEGDVWVLATRVQTLGRSEAEQRTSKTRDHFSPVSLHPRRAVSLLHLTQLGPGATILDPCCGTGGILLEGARLGYDMVGSDLDPWMVQGTLQTLTDQGDAPLDARVFVADATRLHEVQDPVDAIVCDLPYGKASGTDHVPIAALYPAFLSSWKNLLAPGARMVLGMAEPAALGDVGKAGFQEVAHFEERVHKSMTRHFVVLERLG